MPSRIWIRSRLPNGSVIDQSRGVADKVVIPPTSLPRLQIARMRARYAGVIAPPDPEDRDTTFIVGTTRPVFIDPTNAANNVGVLPSVYPTLTLDTGTSGVRNYTDNSATPKLIQNIRFRCRVVVTGSNYTFYNCEFEGDPLRGGDLVTHNNTNTGIKNNLFKDCTFDPCTVWSNMAPLRGNNFKLLRCHILHCADGIAQQSPGSPQAVMHAKGTTQNTVMWGCFVHDNAMVSPDAGSAGGISDNAGHVDAGMQMRGGDGNHVFGNDIRCFNSLQRGIGSAGETVVVVQKNAIADEHAGTDWHITGYKYNDATNEMSANISNFMYSPLLGDTGSLIIESNWFDGGAVNINLNPNMTSSTGIVIRNNIMGPRGQRNNQPTSPVLVSCNNAQKPLLSVTGNKLWNGTPYNVITRG